MSADAQEQAKTSEAEVTKETVPDESRNVQMEQASNTAPVDASCTENVKPEKVENQEIEKQEQVAADIEMNNMPSQEDKSSSKTRKRPEMEETPTDAPPLEPSSSAEKSESLKSVIATRPVKRARTAYFIFADEKRPALLKQHAGEGVAVVAKALGHMWANIDAEEKQVYQDKAAAERERVAKDMEAWKAAGGVEVEVESNERLPTNSLILPHARVRKICKLDPDVKNLSKEALLMVCKSAELALAQLGKETVKVAQIQNRRTLIPDDVAQVCATREPFLFLREDLQDLARAAAAAQSEKRKASSNAIKKEEKSQGRTLTDYFAPKNRTDHQ